MRELHQQLVSCMNHFVDELQKYQSAQVEKINSRGDALRRELNDAREIIDDIDLLLESKAATAVGKKEIINRCEEFFNNCIDISQCDDDFSYLDFVQAGRLYVRSEHLGYLKLCDAVPEEVELRPATNSRAVCHREFAVVIQTNHSKCVGAEPHLDIQLNDENGGLVPVKVVNNNDGSYSIVFTPTKAGKHQLHVQLFGITVSSSPLEIPVANEAVMPSQSDSRPSVDKSGGASSQQKPGISSNPLAVKLETFDDSDYFAASFSPHSVVKSSPGSAGTGYSDVRVKQEKKDLPVPRDRGDREEVSESMMRMSMGPTSSAGNRGGFWPSSDNRTHIGGSAPMRSTIPSYANGEPLEFAELSYEDHEDFNSSGLNYCSR